MMSTHVTKSRDASGARTRASWTDARGPYYQWRLSAGWFVLILAAALATAVSAAVIEIQAGVTAYLTGEGHWSRARLETVYHLEKYARDGDAHELEMARAAMLIPLGDRAARLALERDPVDLDGARRGFLAGGNSPEDIPRLIWVYQYFSKAPFFAKAVAVWRDAEPYIFSLGDLADRLEAHWATPGAGPVPDALLSDMHGISVTLDPLERRFAAILLEGAAQVRIILLIASGGLFLAISGLALFAHRSSIRRMRSNEDRFRAAFQQSSVGMAKLDADGQVLAINHELALLLQRPAHELLGIRFATLFADVGAADPAWMVLDHSSELGIRQANGGQFWARVTPSPVQLEQEERIFLIVEDVSEARELALTLTHQASHDALTGLINRREIDQRLKVLLAGTHVTGQRHTLCLLDLDQFKLVNDTCSHAAGDEVLRLIAHTLPERLGEQDWIGRLGGDEFAFLLHEKTIEEALEVARGLNRVLADTHLLWEGRHFPLTASIGVVEITANSPSVDWLLRAADMACYLAKDLGGNGVHVYTELDEQVTRRQSDMAWVNRLRSAIVDNRLRLYAQEIVPLGSRAGGLQYEILVRLVGQNGVVWEPGAFLPAAERYGQAMAIDTLVLTQALAEIARHPEHLEQLELCHINVSGQSVVSPGFLKRVEALIDAHPLIAHKICFELTETASISRLSQATLFIESVHARGCHVALDDFGSGLSSFAYLKQLPVDIIKIDGLFVRDIDRNPLDRAIVTAITDVARSQGMQTIAEWVENDEVKQCLANIGVDAGQGFAIHRPVPLHEFIASRKAASAPAATVARTAT